MGKGRGSIPADRRCFFKACDKLAEWLIDYKGKTVFVCKGHNKTWGSSYEQRNP